MTRHHRFNPWHAAMIAVALALLAAAVLFSQGCAQLGIAQPQTLNERIAVTVTSVTAVRQSTQTLLAAKKITPDDAQNVQMQADNVIAAATIARTLSGTDPAAADAKLQQAKTVLTALQAYLTTREAAKP